MKPQTESKPCRVGTILRFAILGVLIAVITSSCASPSNVRPARISSPDQVKGATLLKDHSP